MPDRIPRARLVINWEHVFLSFRRAGVRLNELEAKICIPYRTLYEYSRGTFRPGFDAGEQIVNEWAALTGLPLDRLPRMPAVENAHARRRA